MPEGGHIPQPCDNRRQVFDYKIDFRFGVIDAETEANGSMRRRKGDAHGPQYMGRLQRPGSAGRAG